MHTMEYNNSNQAALTFATSASNSDGLQLNNVDSANIETCNNRQDLFYHNPSFLRIVQDPYPPINCSPEIFDPTTSCFSNQISMVDFINMDEIIGVEGISTPEIKQEGGFHHEERLRFLK